MKLIIIGTPGEPFTYTSDDGTLREIIRLWKSFKKNGSPTHVECISKSKVLKVSIFFQDAIEIRLEE